MPDRSSFFATGKPRPFTVDDFRAGLARYRERAGLAPFLARGGALASALGAGALVHEIAAAAEIERSAARAKFEAELNLRRRLCYAGPMRPWCSRLRAVLGALAR